MSRAEASALLEELGDLARRQDLALEGGDVEAAMRLGESRAATCDRLAGAMAGGGGGRLPDPALAPGLREARRRALGSLRTARRIARRLRGELDELDREALPQVRYGGESGAVPRYLDRTG